MWRCGVGTQVVPVGIGKRIRWIVSGFEFEAAMVRGKVRRLELGLGSGVGVGFGLGEDFSWDIVRNWG